MDTLVEFAEKAREWHMLVSSSENWEIAHYQTDIYRSSQRLFKAAIRAAYPFLDETDIYDVWVDCNESVAYCAEYVRNNPDSRVYSTPR